LTAAGTLPVEKYRITTVNFLLRGQPIWPGGVQGVLASYGHSVTFIEHARKRDERAQGNFGRRLMDMVLPDIDAYRDRQKLALACGKAWRRSSRLRTRQGSIRCNRAARMRLRRTRQSAVLAELLWQATKQP